MPASTMVVLGVDGGGTKTTAALVRWLGQSLHSGAPSSSGGQKALDEAVIATAGPTNWNSVGLEVANANLEAVLTAVLSAAMARPAEVTHVVLGMAAVDNAAHKELVQRWVLAFFAKAAAAATPSGGPCEMPRVHVFGDAVVALASGTGGPLRGIALISGTGVICYGRDHRGMEARSAGWGPLLGDGGSGYAIGAAALHAVARASDGRGPLTALSGLVLGQLRLAQAGDLIEWVYGGNQAWDKVAELFPAVLRAAGDGDLVAQAILGAAADELATAVVAVERRLSLAGDCSPQCATTVVLAGGVLAQPTMAKMVRDRLRQQLPHMRAAGPLLHPATAAAALAASVPAEELDAVTM